MKKYTKNAGQVNFRNKGKLTTKAEIASKIGTQKVAGMRLNKYIAHCGVSTRRKASELVKSGKIKVNDEVANESFYQIQVGDKVEYNGKIIQPEQQQIYVLMNKPKNVVVNQNDKESRTSVLDIIGQKPTSQLVPVGELDKGTTGLLLITNDSELAQKITQTNRKLKKMYQIFTDKPVSEQQLKQIATGVVSDDEQLVVDKVFYSSGKEKTDITIELDHGSDLAIRRVFKQLGYGVERLDRIYFGGLTKKDLPRGQFRFLSEREVIMLKHFS